MPGYDILIPAFNASQTLARLIAAILELQTTPKHIYVVDDGSTDETSDNLKSFPVTVLKNHKNMGKGYSLRRGYEYFLRNSDSQILICMDADLQHLPSSIPRFLESNRANEKHILIGNREKRFFTMPILRIVSNLSTSKILSWLTKQRILDSQCGYRLIRRHVLESIQLNENGFQLESEFIIKAARAGHQIGFVPIPTIYNNQPSNIRHLADTLQFIRLISREILPW